MTILSREWSLLQDLGSVIRAAMDAVADDDWARAQYEVSAAESKLIDAKLAIERHVGV